MVFRLKKIPFLNGKEMTQVITMFFQRIINNTSDMRGKQSFLDSVTTKYNHVKSRCQLMQSEANEQGESMLELFDEAEIIGVKALLEGGEDEFDQLKEQYNAANKISEVPEEEEKEEEEQEDNNESITHTSDIVD